MASTDPKTATQAQWEDLADKVNAKVEVGSVIANPPSVPYVGTGSIEDSAVTTAKLANTAVTTAKIADDAVTADKMDFTTFLTNPKFIQSGTESNVTFQGTNNVGGGFITINFPTEFDHTPIVLTSSSVNTGYMAAAMVTSVSTTQFTCLARVGSPGDSTGKNIYWTAIDVQALGITNQ